MRFVISYSNTAPTVYTKIESSGVLFTMRYLVAPKKRRGSEQTIYEAVLRAFAPHDDIDFAYPTQREFINYQEKKGGPDDPPDYHSTRRSVIGSRIKQFTRDWGSGDWRLVNPTHL